MTNKIVISPANNDNTRKAYLNAARRFSAWCAAHGIEALATVEPIHVAAFVKSLEKEFSARPSSSIQRRSVCCSTGW